MHAVPEADSTKHADITHPPSLHTAHVSKNTSLPDATVAGYILFWQKEWACTASEPKNIPALG